MFVQLQVCFVVSMASGVLSVVAVIIYSVDMDKNPEVTCIKMMHGNCDNKHYATVGVSHVFLYLFCLLLCLFYVIWLFYVSMLSCFVFCSIQFRYSSKTNLRTFYR